MNKTLKTFVKSKRALNILLKNGYETYDDIKELTIDDYRRMEGMGEVSAQELMNDIADYRKELYKELMIRVEGIADKYGAEMIIELLDNIEG